MDVEHAQAEITFDGCQIGQQRGEMTRVAVPILAVRGQVLGDEVDLLDSRGDQALCFGHYRFTRAAAQ